MLDEHDSVVLPTPLRRGVAMLGLTLGLFVVFLAMFASLHFSPRAVQQYVKPPLVILVFAALSVALWYWVGRQLPSQFSAVQILTVIAVGTSPILSGILYQYCLLAFVGAEACVGGNIVGLVLGTAAAIVAVAAVLIGTRTSKRLRNV